MTYIIAETGSVSDGSLGAALKLIEHCAELGADAVKFQDHLGEVIKGSPPWLTAHWYREDREAYLRRTQFTDIGWVAIKRQCKQHRVDLVVSPFSVEAVNRLENWAAPDAYKIASGQVTNLPMLEAVAKTGRRVILSSGMTNGDEFGEAAATCKPWAVLQCTSSYPCPPEQVGLNKVSIWVSEGKMRALGAVHIGLSDHTLGFAASLAAIALGATVIERHVCFDRRGYGTDCAHSLTLDEFGAFVKEVRALDVMLANPVDKDALCATPEIQKMRECFLEVP